MSIPRSQVLFLFLCASLSPSASVCNLPQAPQTEELQTIVDFNDVLEETKPSTFAAISLKNTLQQAAVQLHMPKTREQGPESKTSIFNKSMLSFIKKIYNHKAYAAELSQNAGHMLQFFDLGNELSLGTDAMYVSLRLFFNKMKSAEVLDVPMLIQLLDATPHNFERYFVSYDMEPKSANLDYLKKHLEQMILSKFTRDVHIFRDDPDHFVSQLSSDLAHYYHDEAAQKKSIAKKYEATERLRNLLIRFYDLALNKAMWNPHQPGTIWQSFTTLAQGLQLLGEYGIVKHMDELDDLFWSLTHRFSYFLDLAGSQLPLAFYEQVEKDLDAGAVYFLEYQEQDEGITTKKNTIREALALAKTGAIAYEKKAIFSAPINLKARRISCNQAPIG
jgi:hypothetical protein